MIRTIRIQIILKTMNMIRTIRIQTILKTMNTLIIRLTHDTPKKILIRKSDANHQCHDTLNFFFKY